MTYQKMNVLYWFKKSMNKFLKTYPQISQFKLLTTHLTKILILEKLLIKPLAKYLMPIETLG